MELKEMSNKKLKRHTCILCVNYDPEKGGSQELVDAHDELLSRLEAIDNLKCCGNCKIRNEYKCDNVTFIGDKDFLLPEVNWVCDQYQSDLLTRSEREIK